MHLQIHTHTQNICAHIRIHTTQSFDLIWINERKGVLEEDREWRTLFWLFSLFSFNYLLLNKKEGKENKQTKVFP